MFVKLFVGAVFSFATTAASAAGGAGTTGAEFLNIGVGERAAAMAGSYAAIADDASAIYWNPAGLARMIQQEVHFSHTQWIDAISYDYGLYAYPDAKRGTFGAGIEMMNKSGIPGYDETGASLGNISARSMAFSAGWGKALYPGGPSVGVSGKIIRESLAGYSSSGFAVNFGGLYPLYERPNLNVTGALAVRNVGTQSAFVSQASALPRTIDFGLGLHTFDHKLVVGLDGIFRDLSGAYGTIGAEYWIHPAVALRSGLRFDADVGSGFSSGIGVRVGSAQFDYSLSDFGALGIVHRGGISLRFGGGISRYYQEGVDLMRLGHYAEAFVKFNQILVERPEDKSVILRMKECQQHIEAELKEMKDIEKQATKQ